jgi:copper transport protein
MPARAARVRQGVRGCAGALLLVVLAGLAAAPPAWAHASLVGSDPPAGTTLAQPPATLRLDFNEPVSPLIVRLVGPTGEAVTPTVAAQNSSLTIVPPRLGRGTYVLSWRVISADGHPVGGSVLFSIGAPSAGPAQAALDTDPAVLVAIWATRLLIYLGLFVGIGGASFIALIAQARPLPGRTETWIAGAMAGGVTASIVSLSLQGLDALALPLTQVWRPDVWASGLATSYGWTAVVAALAMLLGLVPLRATKPVLVGLCASGALVGAGFALALSGHAATAGLERLSRPAVFLHGVCIAFWVGSLLPLAAIVRARGRGDAELTRFSRLIPVPLAVLVATGSYLAWLQLDRPDALWTTSYGMVLSGKLAGVMGLLGLAAANRFVLVPRLKARAPGAARPLIASIAAESVLALAILGMVAVWRFTPPPRALIGAEQTSIHFHGGKAMAQIEVEPVRARGADMSIDVLDPMFHPMAVAGVTIFLSNPQAGIEPLRRDAERAGDAGWRIDDLRIPIAGRWTLRVDVLINDFEKETLEDDVLLPRAPSQ